MTTLTLRDAVEVVLEGYTLHEGARKILETAIAQELASQSANTKPVVSQKPAETTDNLVRSCATCKYQPQTLHSALPKCIHCKAFSNWEPKP